MQEAAPDGTFMSEAIDASAGRPGRHRRRSAIPVVFIVAAMLLSAGYFGIRKAYPAMFADSRTFDIFWTPPSGWIEKPKTPFTVFLYRHPQHDVYIKAFQFHCDAEFNVSPEMDADALADYYLATTKQNQPDWTAKKVGDVDSGDLRFAIIERRKSDKIVITAFATKGNTTLGVALYAGNENVKYAQDTVPLLKEFVKTIYLKPTKRHGNMITAELAADVDH